MRFLSTKIHGVLDYMTGLLLIAAPWLLGFADQGPATWVPVVLGIGAILYSLMTNYELGVIKTLSMPTHLWLDALSGAFLAASPWIFGFSDRVYLPHLLLGIFEIAASLVTQTTPHPHTTGHYRTETQGRHI
jgi:hypothetical protein